MAAKWLNVAIHGYPIIAWAQTGTLNGKAFGIILVRKPSEWVTATYQQGEGEWSSGNYFSREDAAWTDFFARVKTRLPCDVR